MLSFQPRARKLIKRLSKSMACCRVLRINKNTFKFILVKIT